METDEKRWHRLLVNGEIPALIEALRQDPEQEGLLHRYERIFVQKPPLFEYPTEDPFLKRILEIYYRYYVYIFGEGHSPQEGEKWLTSAFQEYYEVKRPVPVRVAELRLKWLLYQRGYHFLGGTTAAFYGPYIWKTTKKTVYSVEIPSGTIRVPVFFMKQFLSNSWLSFLSFGKTGTGGWTKPRGLFCRWDDYKDRLDQPSFQISFLKHEAQHLYDFRHFFPRLSGPVLEYRAKLCELTYFPDFSLLERFVNTAKDDGNFAHSQAEHWILSDLSHELFGKERPEDPILWQENLSKIPEVCRKLLRENQRIGLPNRQK
ncbi:MAG TPA: hypothetical protein P5154_03785 [Candidatus Izemoplasmatales bacterium]|nr:hypothetical protein [Candidatus Izemoplasmatales bacterium]